MYNQEMLKNLFKSLGVKINFAYRIKKDCFHAVLTDKKDFILGNIIYVWNGEIISKKQWYENYEKSLDI